LKADYDRWHPTIQTVIDTIDKDSCYRYALNNREDEDEMRKAFHEKNLNKSRAEWLYCYDPLTVPLV
jgi:hypothetical protein